jgi:hypothetical protein
MGMALSFLSENQTLKNKIHLCSSYFLTDNQWLVGILQKGLPTRHVLSPLLSSVREMLNIVTTFKKPKVKWIPGHISGAVKAINLAKKGAKLVHDSVIVSAHPIVIPTPKLPSGVTRFDHSVLRDGCVSTC